MRSLNSPHLTRNSFHWARFISQHQWISILSHVFYFNTLFCWSDHPKTSINTIYATIRQTNNQPIRQTVSRASDSGRLSLIVSPTSNGMIKKTKQKTNRDKKLASVCYLQGNISVCVCLLICMHAYFMLCGSFAVAIPFAFSCTFPRNYNCLSFSKRQQRSSYFLHSTRIQMPGGGKR